MTAYLFLRQMLALAEPTKTRRWKWHGVLICTEHAYQEESSRWFWSASHPGSQ
jgi:hypothetical protein